MAMTSLPESRPLTVLAVAVVLLIAAGCGEDKVVYMCPTDGQPASSATDASRSVDTATPSMPDAAGAERGAADGPAASDGSAADAPAVAPDGATGDVYARPTYDAIPNMGMKATGLYVYASGYTPSGVTHDDVYIFQLDQMNGRLDLKGRVPGLGQNPSFTIAHEKKFLYVAAEGGSRLNALKIEEHGGLTPINWVSSQGQVATVPAYPPERLTRVNSMGMTVPAAGANPVFVKMHRSGKWIFTANYYGDVAVYPRRDDGGLEMPTVYFTGRNTHTVNIHPTKDIVYVTNTAHNGVFTNSISIFTMNPTTGVLTPHPTQPRFDERPFLLVRHLAFHPSGDYLYGIGEAPDTVAAFKVAADGSLSAAKEYPSLPAGVEDPLNRITGAEIVLSGDVLFASLRGSQRDNTKTWIVSYRVDAKDPSKLTLIEHMETRGDHARGFTVDASGKFLVVANQWTSDLMTDRNVAGNLSTFSIGVNGKLTYLATTNPGDMAPATVATVQF